MDYMQLKSEEGKAVLAADDKVSEEEKKAEGKYIYDFKSHDCTSKHSCKCADCMCLTLCVHVCYGLRCHPA